MTWLSPMAAILAGAITVPLLVLLYFLKLRRREVSVSSTLLWKRAVQDLQVNAPFQRLRRNILLLLQLLALLALVAVLGGPMVRLRGGTSQRFVLLIDRSASMEATDEKPNRLAAAKAKAREFVRTLRTDDVFGHADQAMVIAFAADPQVISGFTSSRRDLINAIESIQPTDGGTRIAEAIRIARAHATATDPESLGRSVLAPAKLVLFTDGRISDLDRVATRGQDITVYPVGKSADNLALIALQARRSFEDPDQATVFAGLANYRPQAAECDLQLLLDGRVVGSQHAKIPAAQAAKGSQYSTPGQTGVTFSVESSGGGVIEVRLVTDVPDVLRADDTAWNILAPPRRLAVLLVGQGNLVLEEALRALPLARVETMAPEKFNALDPDKFEAEKTFDAVILDRCAPQVKRLPRGGYLVLGPPPPLKGLSADGPHEDQFILDWRPNHAALRFINLENLFAKTWWKYNLPADAHVLAESDRGPAMALLGRQGSSYLLVNFDVLSSNWPFQPGFVMFLYNAINLLGNPVESGPTESLAVNSSLNLRVPKNVSDVRIVRPDGKVVRRGSDPSGYLRYAPLDRAGVYRVELPDNKTQSFAVNLLDSVESHIQPAGKLSFAGETVAAQQAGVVPANRDLKPWLWLFALAVLGLEWFIYNKKVQI